MNDDIFTTTEIAKICRVSRMTVNRWLQEGNLKGYKSTPKSNWKVTRKELLNFMQSNNIPLDLLKTEKVKILIVDDEETVTTLLLKALTRERRFLVDIANSGFRAGIKLTEFIPDLVILDIVLGDLDGRDFFKHIMENPYLTNVKVIGISGKIEPFEAKQLIEMGFNAFLEKPLDLEELIDTIYKLTEE